MSDPGLLEIHLWFRNRPRPSAPEDPQEGLRERLSPGVHEQFGPEPDGPDDSLRGLPIPIAGATTPFGLTEGSKSKPTRYSPGVAWDVCMGRIREDFNSF